MPGAAVRAERQLFLMLSDTKEPYGFFDLRSIRFIFYSLILRTAPIPSAPGPT